MAPIRQYIFVIIGLIVLGFIAGPVPTLWVVVALILAIGLNHLPSYFSLLGIISWLGAVILLFMRFGWVVCVGFAILSFGYIMIRETPEARMERLVSRLRQSLREDIVQRNAGSITQEQLEQRAFLLLKHDLPREVHYLDDLQKQLFSEDGMDADEYQMYLRLFQHYFAEVDWRPPVSNLHNVVRERLGLPPYSFADFESKVDELMRRKREEGDSV